METGQKNGINMKKLALWTVLVYIVLVVLFYYLAGKQLHLRASRDNFVQPPAESVTAELVPGAVVEQTFRAKIQRLESVSVQWGTFYRPNAGTATMELYDQNTGALLLSQSFNVADIPEGGLTTLIAPAPIETVYDVPLLLRIYADSAAGEAVSPLMSASAEPKEGFALTVNSTPADGVLCMNVSGEDYIWTGLHYWKLAAGFGAVLVLGLAVIWRRYHLGKHSYVIGALMAVKKYDFLIRQLVSRNFKTKYKRSVLGMFWSFLNPLLTMAVQYTIFSTLFKSDIPNYGAYLIIGIVLFNFFIEATNTSLTSIIDNAGLIKKVYMPKYIYPFTRVLSAMVNLVISLAPLLIVVLLSGVRLTKALLLVPFVLMCLMLFSLGVGLLLASMMVFFRDTQFLWGVLSMIWMYATPIFYPASILPENLAWVLRVNPLYYYVTFARTCITGGISPEPFTYFLCMMMALAALVLGTLVFRKAQDRFVLYL